MSLYAALWFLPSGPVLERAEPMTVQETVLPAQCRHGLMGLPGGSLPSHFLSDCITSPSTNNAQRRVCCVCPGIYQTFKNSMQLHFSETRIPLIHSCITWWIIPIRKAKTNSQNLKHECCEVLLSRKPDIIVCVCVCVCNKVLLKYKGDRESFWHKHQLIKIFPTLDMTSCFSLVYISFFPQKIRTLHRHFRLYSDVLKLDISGLMIIIYLFSNYFCCCSSYTLKVLPVLKFISLRERVPLQEE